MKMKRLPGRWKLTSPYKVGTRVTKVTYDKVPEAMNFGVLA